MFSAAHPSRSGPVRAAPRIGETSRSKAGWGSVRRCRRTDPPRGGCRAEQSKRQARVRRWRAEVPTPRRRSRGQRSSHHPHRFQVREKTTRVSISMGRHACDTDGAMMPCACGIPKGRLTSDGSSQTVCLNSSAQSTCTLIARESVGAVHLGPRRRWLGRTRDLDAVQPARGKGDDRNHGDQLSGWAPQSVRC